MKRKRKGDDESRLVELLARGERAYAEIARELGMDERTVAEIARGELRPQVYQRIRAAQEGYRQEARRFGTRWAKSLLTKHIKAGLEGDDETARKCREYALSEFLKGEAGKDGPPAVDADSLVKLTSEDLEALAVAHGGPRRRKRREGK